MDVVLDLMIHDVDVVLALTGAEPEEIRAAGIRILSEKVDIANVRLQFPNGCVANLTASRVSTERVRKLRLFQPQQYLSLDYTRQDLADVFGRRRASDRVRTGESDEVRTAVSYNWMHSSTAVESRNPPKCNGSAARLSLGVVLAILDKIEEHSEIVSRSLEAGWKP